MTAAIFRILTVLCLLCLPLAARGPSMAAMMPQGAVAYAELSELSATVTALRDSAALGQVLASDEYKAWASSADGRKFTAGQAMAQLLLGQSPWDSAAALLGGRLALALYPDKEPVILLRPADGAIMTKVRDVVRPLLEASGTAADTTALCPGTGTWQTKDGLWVTLHADWIAAARQRTLLDRTLTLLAGGKNEAALSALPAFRDMDALVPDTAHLRLWGDLALLREKLGPHFGLPEKAEDGGASFIFGGLLAMAERVPFAAAGVEFSASGAAVHIALPGDPSALPEPAGIWFARHPDTGVIALPSVPGALAAVTVHRRLGEWYRRRDDLLAPRLLPAFDKFETDIGNLLPRKDFGEDVMPLIGDNFTLIAALQNYGHLGSARPGIRLPAFAAIFDLPQPAKGADTFGLFFQTLAAILNLQAGQEGRQPSVLDSEMYKDTKIAYSRFLDPPEGERLAIAYNFQPAGACAGRKYILASSVQLCRDLIDHFQNPAATAWQNRNAEFVLKGEALAQLAAENEAHLRSQQISKGQSPDGAARRIGLLLAALRRLDEVRYHSGTGAGHFSMHASVRWR